MNPTTTILLARHGQSTWNLEHRWQGQADPPLAESGQQQAAEAAKVVGTVDAIISSPQQRALQSALIISELVGVGPVATHEDLRERSAGEWSGLTREEIYSQWPDWETTGYRPKGWEADDHLVARTTAAINEISQNYPGGTLLIITHSGVIISLEKHLGIFEGRIPNMHGRVITHQNGQITGKDRLLLVSDKIATGGGLVEEL